MSALSKFFILSTLVLSAFTLTTPHVTRNLHQHHALVARKAVPDPMPAVGPYADLTVVKPRKLRRRSDTSRCAVKPSNSTSSVSSSAAPSSSLPPAVGVVAGPPSSSQAHSTQAPPPPPPPPSSQAAPPPPPPTSTHTPPPPSSTHAPAPSSSSSSSGNSPSYLLGQQTGQITFYADGLGACGITNSPSDKIAAVSEILFDSYPGYNGVNPNQNPVCGKSVTINYQGKSVTVKIVDRCTACAVTSLDLSTSAFDELADESIGRLFGATWTWND
ncbi:hypothetical protein EW145_g5726 [Phellinidium pouzarii]|uniref:RlpA-like protein double-psi beta-barrel domain-containing protein n=1 Tax=Phellinidium pouzarii TaxID=167371 RepID=A0A4S4L3S2_9AGAM|nr:hypothetical protein EW145_g5726 [Phellinidium pouzarii]